MKKTTMKNKLLELFLLLLSHIAAEVFLVVAMAEFVANKRLLLIFISAVGLHYCVSKVTEYTDRLLSDDYIEEEEEDNNG